MTKRAQDRQLCSLGSGTESGRCAKVAKKKSVISTPLLLCYGNESMASALFNYLDSRQINCTVTCPQDSSHYNGPHSRLPNQVSHGRSIELCPGDVRFMVG
jgi:hypothetical protein